MSLQKKIEQVRDEIAKIQQELAVSLEQLSFLGEVADEAKTRQVVEQSPLADRDLKEAQGDLDRHRRYHESLLSKLESLKAEQDRLLEQMIQSPGG